MTDYQLWLGDCLEEMNRIEDGSIDCILADLPYGTTACAFDVRIPFEPLWVHYKRVIKKNGAIVLFGSEPFSSLLRLSNLDWYKYDWVWNKAQSGNARGLAKFQPLKIVEDICIFSKNTHIYIPQMRKGKLRNKNGTGKIDQIATGLKFGIATRNDTYYPTNILYFPNCANKQSRLHPTQKPVALLSYLIKTYTNEGDLILDNTCGSGSTLEAAMRTKRRSIGIEKDKGYLEIASQRLERVAAELRGELNHLPMFAGVRDG